MINSGNKMPDNFEEFFKKFKSEIKLIDLKCDNYQQFLNSCLNNEYREFFF
jgi:hypothetical protein